MQKITVVRLSSVRASFIGLTFISLIILWSGVFFAPKTMPWVLTIAWVSGVLGIYADLERAAVKLIPTEKRKYMDSKLLDTLRKIPSSSLIEIAKSNVKQFEKKIAAGEAGNQYVNLMECQHYMGVWKSVIAKLAEIDALNSDEIFELIDAIYSGEYDKLDGVAAVSDDTNTYAGD